MAHFLQASEHKRAKARRHKEKVRESIRDGVAVLRAKRDVVIPAETVKKVEVEGHFKDNRTWFVEKFTLANEDDPLFLTPNTLIDRENPFLPVANPTATPKVIRRGEILGQLLDAEAALDGARDESHYSEMARHAWTIKTMIDARLNGEGTVNDERPSTPTPPMSTETSREAHLGEGAGDARDAPPPEPEQFGPKLAEVPSDEVFDSARIKEILDVGDLPDHLRDQAWDMLQRRVKAFGFDGRLGHHPSKVHIRTQEGQTPIAVPMYGASPAKREVIDKQLKTWFEQDVIEPSISPWSAPVVIVYRNGKARFCVDYRKLNSVTTPDEFPIPRQSEILSSLAGAQVLSSLDALSGFTQLEMDPADVEKTAFRTHQGLFQFKRMPFGLRNGPSIFQRVMQGILAPFLWLFCLVYIDDIVVYSKSFEDHIEHLDKVLGAIEKAGLTLSPAKCHLFYSSIILLGHKVSRLGLSTHKKKVETILKLKRPSSVAELRTFLGMAVYFSAFIPHYASIASPLFDLTKKGVRMEWKAEHERAFERIKDALATAPVLGHPIQGSPYRLYTDASGDGMGCTLQQVQPIRVADLKGTKAYEKLKAAFEMGEDVPKLVIKVSDKVQDTPVDARWGASLDETVVQVERVIAYWSRRFRGAEERYSTTEREALAAKEALVRFQPFIEGEEILLITDHAALVWSKTYEENNRRLASWGTVFSAYKPGLHIVHRPGRVHSNVDPLSRIFAGVPDYIAPVDEDSAPLKLARDTGTFPKDEPAEKMAEFVTWSLSDVLEATPSFEAFVVTTRAKAAQAKATKAGGGRKEGSQSPESTPPQPPQTDPTPSESIPEGDSSVRPVRGALDRDTKIVGPSDSDEGEGSDPYTRMKEWEASHPPPHVHVHIDPEYLERIIAGYIVDAEFKRIYKDLDKGKNIASWNAGQRFYKDEQGLLFFRDANYQPRLCIPETERKNLLKEAHNLAYDSAHASAAKLWQRLSGKFYWPRMRRDVLIWCDECDVCQKTKHVNFKKFGLLIPNHIPIRPYSSVSLDLITGLPMTEDGFNAILVIVCRMSKHAQFLATDSGLDTQGFAELFVRYVACRFGLPDDVVSDRDPRWTSDVWREIARFLQVRMAVSSSHHPQHDGQTEAVNKQVEQMLRAYVQEDPKSWAKWLPLIEHAYNSNPHTTTGVSPFLVLYGFTPKGPLDYLHDGGLTLSPQFKLLYQRDARAFAEEMHMHRESARNAIARAQVRQSEIYNRGRKEMDLTEGDLVLVNPHSLEWSESKGVGSKLMQRAIGPFAIRERINSKVYRLDMSDKYPGSNVINVEHLRRYKSSATFGDRERLPETRKEKVASEEYEVEDIVAHRKSRRGRGLEFLIRWKGYSPQYDSWEPRANLKNAPSLLSAYLKRVGMY